MFAQQNRGPFGRSRGGPEPDFRGLEEKLRGFRAGRGMMEPAIIGALTEKPMHGYEIITYLEEKTHGVWRPSPGSIYPTLQMMEEKGHVSSQETAGKKVYTLTKAGKEIADQADKWHDESWGKRMNFSHDYQRHFHQHAGEVIKLMRQIFRKGSASQKQAMDQAIDSFIAELRQIAEGEI